jgi:archaellum component FlaC
LDKRGTKQTSLLLDATNNKFYIVDDDSNAYLLNGDEPEYIKSIFDLLNSISDSIDNCPECIISQLNTIMTMIGSITNDQVVSILNSSIMNVMSLNNNILNEINSIKDKIKNETIIIKEVVKEVIKEVVKWKTKIEYVEVKTTVYVTSPTKKPNKVKTLPPKETPPQSIGGWIWDQKNGYFVKWKRGKKYIMGKNDYNYKMITLGCGQVSYLN